MPEKEKNMRQNSHKNFILWQLVLPHTHVVGRFCIFVLSLARTKPLLYVVIILLMAKIIFLPIFLFSTPLSAFILSYSFFCYCVNGKWVFASRIKVYSVSIYFPHAAACLTRKMFCISFCISLLSKEWTLGKNNNKNNSKATLVMTSNRKIRETNRADDFWCCRVFFFVRQQKLVIHLLCCKTFFYWHSTSLDDNFTTTQNFRGWDRKNPFKCHRVN